MADNVTLDAGSGGAVIKTDDDGTAHWQEVKIAHGADGTQTRVTSSAGLPVTPDASGFTVTANLSATDNAVLDAAVALLTTIDADTGAAVVDLAAIEALITAGNVDLAALETLVTAGNVDLAAIEALLTTIDADTGALVIDAAAIEVLLTTVAGDTTAIQAALETAGGLVVNLGANNDVTVTGTVTANLSATDNAVLDAIAADGDAVQALLTTIDADTSNLSVVGGGTEATAQRVTIASDSTGVLSVDDNGGSLTVDGTVTANLSATDNAVLDDIAAKLATIDADTSALAATVGGTELQVDIVSGGGGGTQYAIDTASGGTDTGTVNLAVRDDSLTTLTPIDGDYVPLRVNSTGALHVTGGGGGTQYNVDDVAGGSDTGSALLAVRDDSLTTLTPADGDYTTLRVNSTGALHVTGGGGGTEYVVDAAAPAAPTGTASLMERDDALSTLTEVEGDWTNQRSNARGAMWVELDPTNAVTVDLGANNDVTVTGTVDLGATDNAVLDAIAADTARLDVVGSGTEATALRVTVATDSTGVLSVDDNGSTLSIDDGGGAITVDGTVAVSGSVTVDLGANNDVTVTSGNITADTELPTAAALADNTVNPTVPAVGSFGMVYDGSTWDRQPGTSADGTLVNLGSNNDVTVTSGTITTVSAVTGITNALPAGTNAIGKLAANSGVDIGDVDVTTVGTITPGTAATSLGKAIDSAAGATDTIVGAGVIRDDVLATLTPADADYTHMRVNSMGAQWVQPHAATTGGLTIFRSLDLDESEEDVKTSAGQLYGWYIFNAAASTRYVKLYNATAASTTVGTTTPVLTIPVPAGGAANVFSDKGIAFSTAICAAATTGVADSDTGAPSANDVVVNFFYA